MAIAGLAAITFGLGVVSGMAWLVLPTAAIGLWATAFVRQVAAVAELRSAREELARMAVDEERLRFARDLHDLLGHSLSLITLKSELAGRLLPDEPEKAEAEVHDIEGVARQALGEVREAVAGYRSPTLDEELAGAAEMLGAAGIDFEIENEAGLLPREIDGVLAWAVREGTTNVIRHSQARNCHILLAREDGMVHAEDHRRRPGRNGPGNLRKRALGAGRTRRHLQRRRIRGGTPAGRRIPPARRTSPPAGGNPMSVRVLLAEDQAMVRGAIAALLKL